MRWFVRIELSDSHASTSERKIILRHLEDERNLDARCGGDVPSRHIVRIGRNQLAALNYYPLAAMGVQYILMRGHPFGFVLAMSFVGCLRGGVFTGQRFQIARHALDLPRLQTVDQFEDVLFFFGGDGAHGCSYANNPSIAPLTGPRSSTVSAW